ncbi:MAG: hypothetical protein KGL35_10210, partial [Bradyrhizobium sp.]|nr:hypothetical protein [Bradyrhizobium sp.]
MAGTATPGYATQQEAYQALLQAGASPDVAQILAAVTRPESSGYTAATNNYQGNQYLGLWQIGSFHGFDNARLRSDDILYQAQAALQVYNQQGFNAWQTYSNGSYKQYLDQTPTALALAHLNQITYSQPTATLTPQQRQAAGLPLDNFAKLALGLPWQNGPLAANQQANPLAAGNPAAAPGTGPTAVDAPGAQLESGAANPIGPPGQNTARGNPID